MNARLDDQRAERARRRARERALCACGHARNEHAPAIDGAACYLYAAPDSCNCTAFEEAST